MSRAKPRPFTTGEVKEVIRMYHEGLTQAETGKVLNRHPGVISHVWKDNGLTKRYKITPEIEASLKDMNRRNWTYIRMSIETGIPETTLKRHCKKLNIKYKGGTGRSSE